MSLREFVSRDRQRRFAAGSMPGNAAAATSGVNVYDFCVFKTSAKRHFIGAVAAIHDGRSDVRYVANLTSGTWLCIIKFIVRKRDRSLLIFEGGSTVSCFEAVRYLSRVLHSGTDFFETTDGDVTLAQEFCDYIPE